MAVTVQPVIGDSGSDEVELLRRQVNILVNFVDTLMTQIAGNANYTDFQTDMAAVDITDLREIALTRNIPLPRQFPTHG